MSQIEGNTAVSTVIGVLLMVGLTVVVSSVIIYFMLKFGDMAGSKATIATILKH